MRVRELMSNLSKLDPELEIICFAEDDPSLPDSSPSVFEISEVSQEMVQLMRDARGRPGILFGERENAESVALLSISSDV